MMLRRLIISWKAKRQADRFRALFEEPFEAQIKAARAAHQPVEHLKKAKSAFVHHALERRG